MTATATSEHPATPPWRHRRGPPWWFPSRVLPVMVGVVQVLGSVGVTQHAGGRAGGTVHPLAVLALIAGPVALLYLWRHPVPVLWLVLAATVLVAALGTQGPIFLALIVAVVGTGIRGHRAHVIAALVVGYVAFVWAVPLLRGGPVPTAPEAVGVAAWLLVIVGVAETGRGRRERGIAHAQRRREESRRRAIQERMRIAQELHDVLAHNISLMNVQAGVALHLMDEQPEQARTALTAIKEASNEALGELRSVLDILRQNDDGAPRAPTSGLADIKRLIARTSAAGLDVTARVIGTPRPLPPEVDLAAYRMVQESLTNVTRHAGDARATVVVEYTDDQVIVRVDDAGVGASPSAMDSGNGIAGMRERAAALGGALEAGSRPTGGFSVRATLPVRYRPEGKA